MSSSPTATLLQTDGYAAYDQIGGPNCLTSHFQLLRGTVAREKSKFVCIHIWMYNTP
jgi:hypothetical protein